VPTFGITPVSGFPPVTDTGFPRFIQWQEAGIDVGNRSVENVNFTGDVDLSVSSDGATVTVDVTGGGSTTPSWRDAASDTVLEAADAGNGISFSNTSGAQILTVEDVFSGAHAVALLAYGGATVQIVGASGVEVLVRDGLLAELAGQYAVATLIRRSAGVYILCGDLAS
jgi:hypothetical protein